MDIIKTASNFVDYALLTGGRTVTRDRKDMAEITIEHEGKVLSRVYSGERLAEAAGYVRDYPAVYLVYDKSIEPMVAELRGLDNIRASRAIEATEDDKSIDTVMDLCSWLLGEGADRSSFLLAAGGGITTDIAGFAASIFKRGIRFGYIPTTLLSQVDASIGGKTGVNFAGLKNMIGTIRQPEFTYECPEVLETLPYREFRGGSAEMLKTFIIDDRGGNYEKAVRVLAGIHASSDRPAAIAARRSELLALIHAAAAVKAGVVGRDQFETGERRKLNLGHTFAHAIEKESGYSISHGEAVAVGMVMAAALSDRLGLTDGTLAERLRLDFASCGLPVDCPYGKDALAAAMEKDKKAENGTMHFVLMKGIGEVIIKDMKVSEAL